MSKKEEVTFEEKLTKLEEIVTKLEAGDIPLDSAVKEFNEAIVLAKECDEKLKSAESALNKLINEDGTMSDFSVEEES